MIFFSMFMSCRLWPVDVHVYLGMWGECSVLYQLVLVDLDSYIHTHTHLFKVGRWSIKHIYRSIILEV
jgi:hypothetical protein